MDGETAEIEPKVLPIPRSHSGSYWQNNYCAGRHVVNFQIASEISQMFHHVSIILFFFFMQKIIQKCLQIAVFFFFWYLYPLEQCAPSHLFIFNLLYHPPSLPTVPPLLLQAFVLKGVKFLPCILISEKLSPSTFSLNS